MMRADPSLVPELQIGSWFDSSWLERVGRWLELQTGRWPKSAEGAFWQGVRDAATRTEWDRLTRSSYVALVYHRLAGEGKPGQDRVDVSPSRFHAQLRFMRRLGLVPLTADQVVAFHLDPGRTLPRRSFAVTIDDGFLDCVEPLIRDAASRPQLFVPTSELGGRAHWLGDEAIASWQDLERLERAGVSIGSHSRFHRRLTELGEQELEEDLMGSMTDLRSRLRRPAPILAYPHGASDQRVRRAAAAAGFSIAYSTDKGRNGAGTDPYRLRRVSVHASDGSLSVLWKLATGEGVPAFVWGWRRIAARLGLTQRGQP